MGSLGEYIRSYIAANRCTLPYLGPMSRNSIDICTQISAHHKIPMILIASRRQIDAQELGGGYVENYSTEEFSDYVKSLASPCLFMARDHGGPWQGANEQKLATEEAIATAKKSYEEDILSDFSFIHIDPSISSDARDFDLDIVLDRLFELYSYCVSFAEQHNKTIEFELGTEEQSGGYLCHEHFAYFLEKVDLFCRQHKYPRPTFVVA
ncbi:MAG: hypothetical protein IT292_09985 [Deltaproteobacteria bacterium]|nr:hypothetical protein [Deltaproteobacteria bacterium]